MSQRSNTIKAAGLYTFLSELQAPEGSLVKADNVNIDEMGVATSRRGFNDYGQALPLPDQRVKQILEYKDRIIRHYNDTLSYDDGTENFIDFLGSISEVEDGLRIKSQEVNGNLYFTSSNGIKKLSASTAEDLSSINPINAGVPKAVDVFAKVSPSEVGFLPPNSKVGYKVLYGYRDKNNVLLLGSPTSVFVVSNTSSKSNIPEQFDIEFLSGKTGADFVDGDNISKYFVISTKNTDYYVWYNLTDAATGDETEKPENSDTFGKIEIKVDIVSTDLNNIIAAKTANALLNSLSSFYEVSLVGSIITLVSQEEGDIKDPTEGNLTNEISIEKVQEGILELGISANCEITTTIPSGVDSTFFIQIYRTQFITATEDQELLDISPGEECNLVYEQALTGFQEGDVFTHIDDVTESFRDSGTPLYNNPFSGEGLLQTNEVPPIAKDIESFNNYTFYSNTKTFHRAQFTFISVNDFKNEETALYIGNEDNLRQYVFRGTKQVTTIVCDTVNNTKENEIESNTLLVADYETSIESTSTNPAYIKLYSRENEDKYYIWFNKGTGVDPKQATTPPSELDDTFDGIEVQILNGDTKNDIANKIINNVNQVDGFNLSIISTLSVTLNATTDTFTSTDHNLLNGDKVIYNEEEYYVINAQNNTFQLSDVSPGIENTFITYNGINLAVQVDPINNIIVRNSHGIAEEEQVLFRNTTYYIVNSTTNSFQLSTSISGTPIILTTDEFKETINGIIKYRSTDGITSPLQLPLRSLAFIEEATGNIYIGGRNEFFEFNSPQFLSKSTDGYTFSVISSSNSTIPQGSIEIVHKNSNGRLLLYHETKKLYYSDDEGLNYNIVTLSFNISSIASNANTIVCGVDEATSSSQNILLSNNGGVSFSTIDTGIDANLKVNWIEDDNIFIAYGQSTSTETGVILTSTDGNTWTQVHTVDNTNFVDFDYSENNYAIVSDIGTHSSVDLISWTDNNNVAPFIEDGITKVNFKSIELVKNVYVARTTEDRMVTSLDLVNWDVSLEITNPSLVFFSSFQYDSQRNRLIDVRSSLTPLAEAIIETPVVNIPIQGQTLTVQENSTTNVLELNNHGLENDDYILYKDNEYYVINSTTNNFQLSETSGGSALEITTDDEVDIIKSETYDQVIEVLSSNKLLINNQKAGFAGDNSNGVVIVNQPNMEVIQNKKGHSSYITLYSAEDEFKYYIWFDKGSGIDPLVDSAIPIKVNLSSKLLTGAENVSSYLNTALLDILDFETTYSSFENKTVTITNVENGKSTEASTPNNNAATDIGTGWSISSTLGTGEDASNNYCKWSIDPSLGISIERTARSFVRVVNQDQSSPVNAFYLSGDADNPGLILLENKNLEDKPFYIGVGNIGTIGSKISDEFDPALPFVNSDTISVEQDPLNEGELTITTNTLHNLENGNVIYFNRPLSISNEEVVANYTVKNVNIDIVAIDDEDLDLENTFLFYSLSKLINGDIILYDSNKYKVTSLQEDLSTGELRYTFNLEDIVESSQLSKPNGSVLLNAKKGTKFNIEADFSLIPLASILQPIPSPPPIINDVVNFQDPTGLLKQGSIVKVNGDSNIYQVNGRGSVTLSNVKTGTFYETNNATSTSISYNIYLESMYFYKTDLKSENEEKQNRIYYSKLLQPEAVPIANFIDVGGKNEPIERILALRDTLFILKTDGVYTLTGFAPPFNVRLLDNTSKIIAPDSAAILSNQIYTLTEDGVVTITESGVAIVSRPIEDKILDVTKESFDFKSKIVATSYQNDKSYIIWLPTSQEDEIATQAYRYNFFEKTWTRWTVPVTSALVSRKNVLYIGNGDRQYLQKERKNRDRTDYADRNFTVQIPENSINQKIIRLNDYSEVEIGDVFVQEQYITIDRFNNLLAKLNLDPGCDLDYETEDLIAKPGDNIASNLSLLNTRLIQDGISLTLQTWNNSNIEELKDTYNVFIGQLNELNSGTGFKTYKTIDTITTYESIILNKNTRRPDLNELELISDPRFLQGNIEVYKAIKVEMQWNPLHYGDPSAQKQFSKGTVIVDQNNFTKATVSYSSDISQEFVEIEKFGKGVGYFSSGDYGNLNLTWGGAGSDAPIMNIIPREKQRGRYLNVKFIHKVARENVRVLGVSTVIRAVSDRAFR